MRLSDDFERHAEVKGDVGMDREAVELLHPIAIHAAHGVAGQRGENVAVGQHEVAGAEQRQDLPFVAVGEVRGVDERKRRRREELAFLAFGRGFLDEDGRIPLREKDAIAFQFEPALHEIDLGGFPRAIQALDSDQFSGVVAFWGNHAGDIRECVPEMQPEIPESEAVDMYVIRTLAINIYEYEQTLIAAAREAREHAYAPYSQFRRRSGAADEERPGLLRAAMSRTFPLA